MYNTDLHLHSCLSPCADDNMTPQALVAAAREAGIDLIALTDHNTCRNCALTAEEAEKAGIGLSAADSAGVPLQLLRYYPDSDRYLYTASSNLMQLLS